MRSEQEVYVADLVYKYRHQLMEKGRILVRKDEQDQATRAGDPANEAAIFTQVLDGCCLTLAYSKRAADRIHVLDWKFTDISSN